MPEITTIFGFTLSKKKLLQLILEKIACDKTWAGEYSVSDVRAQLLECDDELVHDGKLYTFIDLQHMVGGDLGQAKMRELFPDMPTSVKFFFNPVDDENTWHVGLALDKSTTVPDGWPRIQEEYLEIMEWIYERYEHRIDGDADPAFYRIPANF